MQCEQCLKAFEREQSLGAPEQTQSGINYSQARSWGF